MDELDLLKRDLLMETQRCVELFNSQIFTNRSIFTKSAFIEVLIHLNYILQKLSKKNNRIVWDDDIQNTKDITDLVNKLRNAACHSDSDENYISDTAVKSVFNVVYGVCHNSIVIGDTGALRNDYKDDIAFYYGDKRIYLIRHIERLLEELPDKISNLV